MTKNITVRGGARRVELTFQNRLIDSYKDQGGFARKWASGWQVGAPDLVAALPGFGVHLVEVKHRPLWRMGDVHTNPLDKIQVKTSRDFVSAGGLVVGLVVFGASGAIGSYLKVFNPGDETITLEKRASVPYVAGRGYDIVRALGKRDFQRG